MYYYRAFGLVIRSELQLSEGVEGQSVKKEGGNMKEKEIPFEPKKKPYQKPELVVHGSVEKITEQSLINREGFKMGPCPPSGCV